MTLDKKKGQDDWKWVLSIYNLFFLINNPNQYGPKLTLLILGVRYMCVP